MRIGADFGQACCINKSEAHLANSRSHSSAKPWYKPIESKTQAVAETQKQAEPFTDVDKPVVAKDRKPSVSRSEKESLNKRHNAHLFRIRQKVTGKFDGVHNPGKATFVLDTMSRYLIPAEEHNAETAFLAANLAAMAISIQTEEEEEEEEEAGLQTPVSARQKRWAVENEEAGSRTPASARHDFGDCGFHDRNNVRDNNNDVSASQILGREWKGVVQAELFQDRDRRPSPMQPLPDVRRRRPPPRHERTSNNMARNRIATTTSSAPSR